MNFETILVVFKELAQNPTHTDIFEFNKAPLSASNEPIFNIKNKLNEKSVGFMFCGHEKIIRYKMPDYRVFNFDDNDFYKFLTDIKCKFHACHPNFQTNSINNCLECSTENYLRQIFKEYATPLVKPCRD